MISPRSDIELLCMVAGIPQGRRLGFSGFSRETQEGRTLRVILLFDGSSVPWGYSMGLV